MRAVDTNVLLRLIVGDDARQTAAAEEFVERGVWASHLVLAETVWVLERAYGFADSEIASAIERTLQADVLMVENEQEVFEAMIALKEGAGSFADALIAALGAKAGCSRTLTFDQRAARLPGFELVS